MEWLGLLTSAIGLVLYLFKRYAKSVPHTPVQRAREIAEDSDRDLQKELDELNRGELDPYSNHTDRDMRDLDSVLGVLAEADKKQPPS